MMENETKRVTGQSRSQGLVEKGMTSSISSLRRVPSRTGKKTPENGIRTILMLQTNESGEGTTLPLFTQKARVP